MVTEETVPVGSTKKKTWRNSLSADMRLLKVDTRARDYKEIWGMDWCSTHDFVLNKQKTQKW